MFWNANKNRCKDCGTEYSLARYKETTSYPNNEPVTLKIWLCASCVFKRGATPTQWRTTVRD